MVSMTQIGCLICQNGPESLLLIESENSMWHGKAREMEGVNIEWLTALLSLFCPDRIALPKDSS